MDDAWCILRFEERIWLVEKINKVARTFVNPGESWEASQSVFLPFPRIFDKSDSFLKLENTSSIVPWIISAVRQTFCTFFPLYHLFFQNIFYENIVHWLLSVSFELFYFMFCVDLGVEFYVWIFCMSILMIERVSSLSKYYAEARLISSYTLWTFSRSYSMNLCCNLNPFQLFI